MSKEDSESRNCVSPNADDHPATVTKLTTPETAPPLLGVHRVVRFLRLIATIVFWPLRILRSISLCQKPTSEDGRLKKKTFGWQPWQARLYDPRFRRWDSR